MNFGLLHVLHSFDIPTAYPVLRDCVGFFRGCQAYAVGVCSNKSLMVSSFSCGLLAAGVLVGFLFQLLGSVVQLREDEGLAVLVACRGIYA